MNISQVGGRYLTMRRRSTKTGQYLKPPPNRNRSASDSVVQAKRHPKESNDLVEIAVKLLNLVNACPRNTNYIFTVLYENDNEDDKKWRLHSTSEPKLQNSNRIEFSMTYTIEYIFERVQLLKVEIRNYASNPSPSTSDNCVIGTAIFKLDELIGAFGAQLRLPLSKRTAIKLSEIGQPEAIPEGNYVGSLLVHGRLPPKSESIILQFAGKNMEKKNKFFNENAVFFVMNRIEDNEDESTELYRSECLQEHSHPVWKPFTLQLRTIADNRNRLLEISAMYRDEVDKTGLIGSFLTTYAKMKYGVGPENVYNVVNAKKKSKKGYKNSGKFELIKFSDVSFYSFLDYITSGTQLHLAVAVDFSWAETLLSNDPTRKDNDFCCALKGIAGIVRDYSSSKLFAAFGFGGKVPPSFIESQNFNLNFENDAHCRGVDGLIEAYRNARRRVMPSDRASCASIINSVIRMAEKTRAQGLHYYILTIFTNGGEISDTKELLGAMLGASKMPISILIVGIGDGDFSEFCRITASRKNIVFDRQGPNRDFVEYIELNAVIDREMPSKYNMRRIAEQALHRVPWHLVAYMHFNNIAAKPPIQITRSPLFHSSELIPAKPTQFNEELYLMDGDHLRARSSTPNAPRKYSDSVVRRSTVKSNYDLWNKNDSHVAAIGSRLKSSTRSRLLSVPVGPSNLDEIDPNYFKSQRFLQVRTPNA